MKIKAIITGTTGMVGKGVLLECLSSEKVENVLVINRSPLDLSHPKLKELIHSDFFDLEEIKKELAGYNACYFCMGVSAAGMSEADYKKITYDLTLNFANTLLAQNPEMTFCYVSGAGTDSSESGRMMWARVKGKTENDLMAMPFKTSYMFRPGYIQPLKGIKSKTKLYQAFYTILKPLYYVLKGFPGLVTNSEKVGLAMINAVENGYDKRILENTDINKIANAG